MTNKIILSSLSSLLFSNALLAQDLLNMYTCGQSLNSKLDQLYSCKTIQPQQEVYTKIIELKDFNTLFSTIDIDNFSKLYQSKKNQQLLNNIYINNYTHTYLLYKKVVNYKKIVEDLPNNFNNTKINFVKKIDLGGEFIALLHIKTHSLNEYKKIKKRIKKKLLTYSNIEIFNKTLLELEKKFDIKIKNYTSNNLPLAYTDDIATLFNNFENFERLIKGENEPIDLKFYHDKTESLTSILNAYFLRNNLNYIKNNPQEFKITDSLNNYAKEFDTINNTLIHYRMNEEKNSSIQMLSLPLRYEATLLSNNIKLPHFTYKIKEENVKAHYPRINPDIKFQFRLNIHENIKRNSTVIIETINMSIKIDNTIIANENNSKIRLDTFVNYPKLRFSKINSKSIGNIEETFIFDKYEQENKVKGSGLIKEAICGYNVNITTKTLQFYCRDIKLEALDITFKHKE